MVEEPDSDDEYLKWKASLTTAASVASSVQCRVPFQSRPIACTPSINEHAMATTLVIPSNPFIVQPPLATKPIAAIIDFVQMPVNISETSSLLLTDLTTSVNSIAGESAVPQQIQGQNLLLANLNTKQQTDLSSAQMKPNPGGFINAKLAAKNLRRMPNKRASIAHALALKENLDFVSC